MILIPERNFRKIMPFQKSRVKKFLKNRGILQFKYKTGKKHTVKGNSRGNYYNQNR